MIRKVQMHHKKKRVMLLVACLICISSLVLFVVNVPPSYKSRIFLGLTISAISIFYFLVFLSMFFLTMTIVNKLLHAFFAGLFITVSSLFLVNDLRNPLFFILLAAVLFVIELLISSWKKKT
jgi:hypothetical protein